MKKHKKIVNNNDFKLLGIGHNGAVYLMPDGKVVKISFNDKNLHREYRILKKVNGNKYFPKIYEVGVNYMIRDYVDGDTLTHHIKKNGLSEDIAREIIDMLKEFKKLKFSKIDIRCKDIFVQPDGKLKIIDPKKCFSSERTFPRHLSKGLYKLKVLDYFLEVLKDYDEKLYDEWYKDINLYIIGNEDLMKKLMPKNSAAHQDIFHCSVR